MEDNFQVSHAIEGFERHEWGESCSAHCRTTDSGTPHLGIVFKKSANHVRRMLVTGGVSGNYHDGGLIHRGSVLP